MKRLVLYVVNAIPALVISYRPSMFFAGTPSGTYDAKRTYHRITGSTLIRLLCLNHVTRYVTDDKTGTEITILEMKEDK